MAKPSVTLRNTKGSALTYTELDDNFTNLKDATVSLTAGTGGTQVTADLNGTITIVAGTNITISGDNSAKTITINSTAGGSGTIQGGDQYDFAFYDLADGNQRLNNSPALFTDSSDGLHLGANLDVNGYLITSVSGSVVFGRQIVLLSVTTTERNAITAANGMMIYNTTTNKFQGYANGSWVDLH